MKNKLEEARDIINEVDQEMVKLFKKRMEAVLKVLEYKKENGLNVLDSSREEFIKVKNLQLLNDEKLEKYYLEFLDGVLKSSKDFQEDYLNRK